MEILVLLAIIAVAIGGFLYYRHDRKAENDAPDRTGGNGDRTGKK